MTAQAAKGVTSQAELTPTKGAELNSRARKDETTWQHEQSKQSSQPPRGQVQQEAARRVRVAGKIPAVVYGAGQDAVAVTVDPKVITKILHSDSGHNTIFDLNVDGAALAKAMIVDWQHEPIKGKLLHIDLKRIAMDKAMRVSVPIQLVGVPVGVKTQGGILEQVLREVEIECLPERHSEPPRCRCFRASN